MAFEAEKDLVLWCSERGGLEISVRKYDQGQAKLQLGPRKYVDKNGNSQQTKVGRLSAAEVAWLFDMRSEIEKHLR